MFDIVGDIVAGVEVEATRLQLSRKPPQRLLGQHDIERIKYFAEERVMVKVVDKIRGRGEWHETCCYIPKFRDSVLASPVYKSDASTWD